MSNISGKLGQNEEQMTAQFIFPSIIPRDGGHSFRSSSAQHSQDIDEPLCISFEVEERDDDLPKEEGLIVSTAQGRKIVIWSPSCKRLIVFPHDAVQKFRQGMFVRFDCANVDGAKTAYNIEVMRQAKHPLLVAQNGSVLLQVTLTGLQNRSKNFKQAREEWLGIVLVPIMDTPKNSSFFGPLQSERILEVLVLFADLYESKWIAFAEKIEGGDGHYRKLQNLPAAVDTLADDIFACHGWRGPNIHAVLQSIQFPGEFERASSRISTTSSNSPALVDPRCFIQQSNKKSLKKDVSVQDWSNEAAKIPSTSASFIAFDHPAAAANPKLNPAVVSIPKLNADNQNQIYPGVAVGPPPEYRGVRHLSSAGVIADVIGIVIGHRQGDLNDALIHTPLGRVIESHTLGDHLPRLGTWVKLIVKERTAGQGSIKFDALKREKIAPVLSTRVVKVKPRPELALQRRIIITCSVSIRRDVIQPEQEYLGLIDEDEENKIPRNDEVACGALCDLFLTQPGNPLSSTWKMKRYHKPATPGTILELKDSFYPKEMGNTCADPVELSRDRVWRSMDLSEELEQEAEHRPAVIICENDEYESCDSASLVAPVQVDHVDNDFLTRSSKANQNTSLQRFVNEPVAPWLNSDGLRFSPTEIRSDEVAHSSRAISNALPRRLLTSPVDGNNSFFTIDRTSGEHSLTTVKVREELIDECDRQNADEKQIKRQTLEKTAKTKKEDLILDIDDGAPFPVAVPVAPSCGRTMTVDEIFFSNFTCQPNRFVVAKENEGSANSVPVEHKKEDKTLLIEFDSAKMTPDWKGNAENSAATTSLGMVDWSFSGSNYRGTVHGPDYGDSEDCRAALKQAAGKSSTGRLDLSVEVKSCATEIALFSPR